MNHSKNQSPKYSLLLVDDNPQNLRLLSDLLTDQGYQIRRVISGEMALKAAVANHFDLILLDINIPDINGYEICRQLKANPKTKNIPTIFISALNEGIDKVKAFSVGGVDYISKPFQFEEVIVRVENQINILTLQKKLNTVNRELKQEIEQRKKELHKTKKELNITRQRLLNSSLRDSVTNLDNKISLMSKLKKLTALSNQNPDFYFTLFLFQYRCPQFPHNVIELNLENTLAMIIANKLVHYFPRANCIARLGREEFIVVLDGLKYRQEAEIKAKNFQKNFSEPLHIQAENILVALDYGIVTVNQNYQKAESIITEARILARQSLENPEPVQIKQDRQPFSNTNWATIFKDNQISLLYQPIISLEDKQVKEVEIFLSCLRLGSQSIIRPEQIVSINKDKEFKNVLLIWLLKKANLDLRQWQERIIWDRQLKDISQEIKVRLKIGEKQLLEANFNHKIIEILERLDITRNNLVIEIPETLFAKDTEEKALAVSQQLAEAKINLAIDNFSFRCLKIQKIIKSRIHSIKLTSSSVDIAPDSLPSQTATAKVLDLAREIAAEVVITEIETLEQLQYWQQLNCNLGTGKFFSEPVGKAEIENAIASNSWFDY